MNVNNFESIYILIYSIVYGGCNPDGEIYHSSIDFVLSFQHINNEIYTQPSIFTIMPLTIHITNFIGY